MNIKSDFHLDYYYNGDWVPFKFSSNYAYLRGYYEGRIEKDNNDRLRIVRHDGFILDENAPKKESK